LNKASCLGGHWEKRDIVTAFHSVVNHLSLA
jgi:hypothetical protein